MRKGLDGLAMLVQEVLKQDPFSRHLFAGSDGGAERWAIICSLIATAKLNDVEPFTYLGDIRQRMVDVYPVIRLDDLLPWNWTPTSVNL